MGSIAILIWWECTKPNLIYTGCTTDQLSKQSNGHKYDVRHRIAVVRQNFPNILHQMAAILKWLEYACSQKIFYIWYTFSTQNVWLEYVCEVLI